MIKIQIIATKLDIFNYFSIIKILHRIKNANDISSKRIKMIEKIAFQRHFYKKIEEYKFVKGLKMKVPED